MLVGPASDLVWESPVALFWIVTVAASLCVVAAATVLVAAHRRDLAEAGLIGSGLMALSVLPLVHGLTAPGVLYGPNQAVMASVYLALPTAIVATAPLLAPRTAFARAASRRWRAWCGGGVVVSWALGGLLLVRPDIFTVPPREHPMTIAVALVGLAAMLRLSRGQLRLHQIGHRPATLVASIGFVLLGLTSLVWFGSRPFSLGWWFVHAIDITGVFAGCYGAWSAHRIRRPVLDVLAPIVGRDPLVALELGLSPVVHDFVAALERKDPITRDHVVRTAEVAIRLGERLGLTPLRLRYLGLGALLHDVGKLATPDEVLHKPGRLTEDEFAVIKRHTVDGDALLLAEPSLAPAAAFVRGHHERVDGNGYPDRLAGDAVPLEARIIAVCDAHDAMAHTRQYREGMGDDRAIAILQEHAGSQWDASVVTAFVDLLPELHRSGILDGVGRHGANATELSCCVDTLPLAVPASR